MRFSAALVALLATDVALASTWFGKAAYNKWHQTELERWLSDHDIPYPKASDRKDLENLVRDNWNTRVGAPYTSWSTEQLQHYLSHKGEEAKKSTEHSKDTLLERVKSSWYETEEQASDAYTNVRDWIFDTWTESQLKAFLDRHGIPNPQPRTRDTLLKTARENYQSIATKAGETASYPGNWLYHAWSDSDLKAWLDERNIPAPQPTQRDKLIAAVRRNARSARFSLASLSRSASSAAASATQVVSDAVFDTWSDSQLKEWADKNGVKVPQGSKRNELIALSRKRRAQLEKSASSALHAATTSAGNQYARATDSAAYTADYFLGIAHSYLDWFKHQIGLGVDHTKASASSASFAASKSGKSASLKASKSGVKATHAAAESASSVKHRAQEAYQKATDRAKEL